MMGYLHDVYAAAARAGLLKTAQIGASQVQVDLRSPDAEVLDGLGLTSDYTMRYPGDAVILDSGSELTIDGVSYRVREVRVIGDGSECRASLTRLS